MLSALPLLRNSRRLKDELYTRNMLRKIWDYYLSVGGAYLFCLKMFVSSECQNVPWMSKCRPVKMLHIVIFQFFKLLLTRLSHWSREINTSKSWGGACWGTLRALTLPSTRTHSVFYSLIYIPPKNTWDGPPPPMQCRNCLNLEYISVVSFVLG